MFAVVKSSQDIGCTVIVRMQTKSGAWIWINIFMSVRHSYACDNEDPVIVCVNHVIFESEAFQFKLESQFLSMYVASSPEYLSQGTTILPQVITKESIGCDLNQYESNVISWGVATTSTTTTSSVDASFARDTRVPAYSPTTGRNLAPNDDRSSYCRVEDFPPQQPASDYGRLDGMSGSLLEQLRSISSGRNDIPCLVRTNEISHGRCNSCVDLCLESSAPAASSSKDRGSRTLAPAPSDFDADCESSHKSSDTLYRRIFSQKSAAVDGGAATASGFASPGRLPAVHTNGGGGGGADWNNYVHSDYYFASHNESSVYCREPAFSC